MFILMAVASCLSSRSTVRICLARAHPVKEYKWNECILPYELSNNKIFIIYNETWTVSMRYLAHRISNYAPVVRRKSSSLQKHSKTAFFVQSFRKMFNSCCNIFHLGGRTSFLDDRINPSTFLWKRLNISLFLMERTWSLGWRNSNLLIRLPTRGGYIF